MSDINEILSILSDVDVDAVQTRVDESLDNGVENDYDLGSWTSAQIAEDLATYDADFECVDPRILEGFCRNWLFRRNMAKNNEEGAA